MKSVIKYFSFSAVVFFTAIIIYNCSGQTEQKVVGFDLNNLDTTVSPADDFYKYAVGNWAKNNPVPDNQSRWSVFERMFEKNSELVKKLLDNAAASKDAGKGSIIQKVGDYYASGLDSVRIEELGITPLKEELDLIENIKSYDDVVKHTAHMHMNAGAPMFGFGSTQDIKNSSWVILGLYQGGLGLPDRDYYLNEDDRSKEVLSKYLKHIENMFVLMGYNQNDAAAFAESVVSIETDLAENSRSKVDLRDPEKNYNKMQIDGLQKIAPNFNWRLFFESVGLTETKDMDVGQPEFFTNLSNKFTSVSINDWKTYFRWNLIRIMSTHLNESFVQERFDFNNRFMNGIKVMQPRWKRVMNSLDNNIGEAVGQLYVEEYFPPAAKQRAKNIVDNLLVSMGERIDAIDWMGDETKIKAKEKLAGFNVKIGYPDRWIDYTELKIDRDSYAKNMINSLKFKAALDLAKIDKPVDRNEWAMTPQTINAYYHPVLNEIVFPAAILQSPVYNPEVDDAINYGAMGAVIGHEITHGFDDQGRQFGVDGNLTDWWTKEDSENFLLRAQKIIEQYNNYEPIDSFYVNGELTQGENIADLGGLTVAFHAFMKTDQYKKGEKIDGFTPQQRFFLSYAEVWKSNIKDENLKLRLKIDPHSPGYYRCIGPLVNMPEFWDAFNVMPGDPMRNPEEKLVKIW